MIRRKDELNVAKMEDFKGGAGTTEFRHLLMAQELGKTGRLFAHTVLHPGASIGYHKHEGEYEVYYILDGTAKLTQDGQVYELHTGDMSVCPPGSEHGIENCSDKDLHYMAAIFFTIQSIITNKIFTKRPAVD